MMVICDHANICKSKICSHRKEHIKDSAWADCDDGECSMIEPKVRCVPITHFISKDEMEL